MIYINSVYDIEDESSHIESVWSLNDNIDIKKEYDIFIKQEAKNINAIIHPNWYNLMNYKNHHSNLTEKEYDDLEMLWNGILDEYNIEWFIESKGGIQIDWRYL